jgi:hypothetical protein
LVCGKETISTVDLYRLITRLSDMTLDGNMSHTLDSIRESKTIARLKSFEVLRRWWHSTCDYGIPLDLLTVLLTCRSSLASNPRDKVYGFLVLHSMPLILFQRPTIPYLLKKSTKNSYRHVSIITRTSKCCVLRTI